MTAAIKNERFRPGFHFSMNRGWINDPNGLIHWNGRYHLFCQHFPDDIKWGPMHWSHAVSDDLVYWKEQPIALYPDKLGTCFSGSAVVDRRNTSGLGENNESALLAFYTAAGDRTFGRRFTQCMAFSVGRGDSWQKFEGNPVLGNVVGDNRDPKVFWHESTRRWIMVLYLAPSTFGLFCSPDAKNWEALSRFEIPGNHECPDLFEIPVEGDCGRTKWVFLSGAGNWMQGDCARYVIGAFDGIGFMPESDPIPIEWGGWNYSTQTYSNAPAGRRILISWFSTPFDGSNVLPGNPFNGQYRIPWELKLMETDDGLRLAKLPVDELKILRDLPMQVLNGELTRGNHIITKDGGRSFDIECVISPGNATSAGFLFEGVEVVNYDFDRKKMRVLERDHTWSLESDGTLKLRILFDVNCVEVFCPAGLKVMSGIYTPEMLKQLDESLPHVSISIIGGSLRIAALNAYQMRRIWQDVP